MLLRNEPSTSRRNRVVILSLASLLLFAVWSFWPTAGKPLGIPSDSSLAVFFIIGDFGVDPSDPEFTTEFQISNRVLASLASVASFYQEHLVQKPAGVLFTGDLVYPKGLDSMEDTR
jgi:hypothetical protein